MKMAFGIAMWCAMAGMFFSLVTPGSAQKPTCQWKRYAKMEAYVQYEDVAYSVIYFQCHQYGPYANPRGVRLQTVDGVEVVTHKSNVKLLRDIGVVK